MVALGDSTSDGSIIFGKNSDRPPNESQPLRYYPRETHPSDSLVQCTYIKVPKARETYEIIVSAPWWIWGAEMGANERSVVIGNESVWSKEPVIKEGALLGMDLLRLALERGETAHAAMNVMIDHLQKYGQGGTCAYGEQSYYDNSFIIADKKEAWIFETAGKYFAARRVNHGTDSLSNAYTIERDYEVAHPDLIKHAIEKKWARSETDFNFVRAYWDFTKEDPAGCQNRRNRSFSLLQEMKGSITPEYIMRVLRDHHEGTVIAPRWSPDQHFWASLCLHARDRDPFHTSGSFVAHLKDKLPTFWFTGSSQPCTSDFKATYLFGGIRPPDIYTRGNDKYSDQSAWWLYEELKRHININYKVYAPIVIAVLRDQEEKTIERARLVERRVHQLSGEGQKEKAQQLVQGFVHGTWLDAVSHIKELNEVLSRLDRFVEKPQHLYREYWHAMNAEAQMPEEYTSL